MSHATKNLVASYIVRPEIIRAVRRVAPLWRVFLKSSPEDLRTFPNLRDVPPGPIQFVRTQDYLLTGKRSRRKFQIRTLSRVYLLEARELI